MTEGGIGVGAFIDASVGRDLWREGVGSIRLSRCVLKHTFLLAGRSGVRWSGQVRVLSEEFCGNLRLRCDSRHESARVPCDEFNSIDRGDDIGLGEHQRQASRRGLDDMRTL